MKKAFLLVVILFMSVISTACINNLAVQELNNKAKCYLDKGDYENAISRLKSSIDLDSTIFETHYNLGIAYTQAEKYPEAIETFQNAIKLKPSFADSYYSLAVAQENYAQGIIEGSITLDGKKKEEAKTNSDENSDNAQQNNLSTIEKAQISKLIKDSLTSYQTYLEKGTEIQDKQDIEEKIEFLTKQAQKYSQSVNLVN